MRKVGIQAIPNELVKDVQNTGRRYRKVQVYVYMFLLLLVELYLYYNKQSTEPNAWIVGGVLLVYGYVVYLGTTQVEKWLTRHYAKEKLVYEDKQTQTIYNHWKRYLTPYEYYVLKGQEIAIHKYYAIFQSKKGNDNDYWQMIRYSLKKRRTYRKWLIFLTVCSHVAMYMVCYSMDTPSNQWLLGGMFMVNILFIALTQKIMKWLYKNTLYTKMVAYAKERY